MIRVVCLFIGYVFGMGVLMLQAVYRHRENIKRLLAGTENKITFSKES